LGMKWLISHVSDIKKYLQRYGRTLILSVWRIRLHPAIPSPTTNIAKTARVEIAPVVCCFDISNVTSVSSPFQTSIRWHVLHLSSKCVDSPTE
jgi:hypothetical protein